MAPATSRCTASPKESPCGGNVGATLLLLLLTVAAFNAVLLVRRLHNGRRRARDIQRYYDGCFNHEAVASGGNRVWRG